MATELAQIRDLLMPGLAKITTQYTTALQWNFLYTKEITAANVLNQPLPKLNIPAVIAGLIIANPTISRRWWKL
jgi:hypothetical protein